MLPVGRSIALYGGNQHANRDAIDVAGVQHSGLLLLFLLVSHHDTQHVLPMGWC